MSDNIENILDEDFNDLREQVFKSLEGKTPAEVGDCFLDVPFEHARIVIRQYVETQPEDFREKFDSYVLSKVQPVAKELVRNSDEYEMYCA